MDGGDPEEDMFALRALCFWERAEPYFVRQLLLTFSSCTSLIMIIARGFVDLSAECKSVSQCIGFYRAYFNPHPQLGKEKITLQYRIIPSMCFNF